MRKALPDFGLDTLLNRGDIAVLGDILRVPSSVFTTKRVLENVF